MSLYRVIRKKRSLRRLNSDDAKRSCVVEEECCVVEQEDFECKAPTSAEIKLIFEQTGDFDLGSEPIVFVSMSSNSKLVFSQPFSLSTTCSMHPSTC